MKELVLSLFLATLAGCATSNKYTSLLTAAPKDARCDIKVYMPNEKPEKAYNSLGVFTVSDNGFSINCDLDNAINENKKAGCLAGADAIFFTTINMPNTGGSSCAQTTSTFLKFK